jgi:hypothetical protein
MILQGNENKTKINVRKPFETKETIIIFINMYMYYVKMQQLK